MSTGAWAWIKGDREDHNNTTCPSGPGGTGPPPNASLGGRMGCAAAPLYGLEFEAVSGPAMPNLFAFQNLGLGWALAVVVWALRPAHLFTPLFATTFYRRRPWSRFGIWWRWWVGTLG